MGIGDLMGNAAVYGLSPFTGGASLLFKDKVRRKAGNLLNDVTGVTAQRDATRAMLDASRESNQVLRDMFGEAIDMQRPYMERGAQTYGRLSDMADAGDFDMEDFQFSGADLALDPGYQFRLGEGQKAIERSAAARGGALSGGTLKDLMRFGQGLASDEMDRAYGRAAGAYGMNQGNRMNRFGRLSTLANMGRGAAQDAGNMAMNFGQQMSNNLLNMGNTQAAGRLGQYNARRGTFRDLFGAGMGAAGMFGG